MSDSKEQPDSVDGFDSSHCYRDYHDAAKWFITCGDTAQDALADVPPVNSAWSKDKPDLICTELKWCAIPRTFFDWLFGRPKRWWVIANFDKA